MSRFSYDVPRNASFDFLANSPNDNDNDAFFDVEHDNHNGALPNEFNITHTKENDAEEKFYSVSPRSAKFRRSISVGNLNLDQIKPNEDINNIVNDLEDLQITTPKQPVKGRKSHSVTNSVLTKTHGMTTRADARRLPNNGRSMSRDFLNIPTEEKPHTSTNRYISMAEAINMFHQKTPSRFHSQPKTHVGNMFKKTGPTAVTIPRSPALQTKLRVRSVSAVSQEEKEIKEIEEAKKHKIKANPINPRILNGTLALSTSMVVKKAPTIPEPFHLTEVPVKKNIPNSPRRLTEFHAKPIPKFVLEPPQPIIKSNLYTVPHTPKFMRRLIVHKQNETIVEPKIKTTDGTKLTVTKPIPFSFEQRDRDALKKREQLRNELLKEEQRLREFHAKPVPKKNSQLGLSNVSTIAEGRNQTMSNIEDKAAGIFPFKARPATVVHRKPFLPKKEERTLTEITEFKLNTEQRAKERNDYDQKKREDEEHRKLQIQENENRKLQQELKEIARLRKEAEVKANPIRRYKEVQTVIAKKLTSPKSPKFLTGHKNKENSEV